MDLGDLTWDALWRDVAGRLAGERAAGRGHLLTEDVLRHHSVLALGDLGVRPSRLTSEYLSPYLRGGKVDLMIDAPGGAAVEFKYPRDSSTGFSPDTMTFGELLKDVVRLPLVRAEVSWVVQALNPRLARYLRDASARLGMAWPFQPGQQTVLTHGHIRGLPATAARALGGLQPAEPIAITCRIAESVDDQLTLFAHLVAPATATDNLHGRDQDGLNAACDVPPALAGAAAPPLKAREGARREILDVVSALLARTGAIDVALTDILIELRRRGSSYADSTIRTMVSSHLCADSQGPGIADYDDLIRTERGRYRPRRPTSPGTR